MIRNTPSTGPMVWAGVVYQTGTNAPTVVEVENTISPPITVTGVRYSIGQYGLVFSEDVLDTALTILMASDPNMFDPGTRFITRAQINDVNLILITTGSFDPAGTSEYNDSVLQTPNELRIKVEIYS